MRTSSSGPSLLAVILIGAAITLGVWRHGTQTPPAQIVIGLDPSLSVEPNCPGVREAALRLLARNGVREGSALSLLAMGASPLDPGPDLRFTTPIPIPGDQVYGRPEQERAYQSAVEALLSGVHQACEQVEDTRHTPLYQLVQQGLTHLRSDGRSCRASGDCVFLIKTDLVEDVHPELRQLLTGPSPDPGATVPAELARSIDNAGVDIVFCGTAETRPVSSTGAPPVSIESRQRIWLQLFTQPERASFQPFCAAPGANR